MRLVRSLSSLLCVAVAASCASAPSHDADGEAPADTDLAIDSDAEPPLEVEAPSLDVVALEARWREQFVPAGSECTWSDVTVVAQVGDGGLGGNEPWIALREMEDDVTSCGGVLRLPTGRYSGSDLRITKPTILVGDGDTTLSATIVSTAGQPVWIQDLTLEDAPFPGAVFASHPAAETTLVNVTIFGATGAGVIQNGGTLRMFDSEIRATRTTWDPLSDPRIDPRQIAAGYGQAGSSTCAHGPFVPHLQAVLDRQGAPGRMGDQLVGWVAWETTEPSEWRPVPMTVDPACLSTGLRVLPGTVAELGNDTLSSSGSAGLVADRAMVLASHLTVIGNGLDGGEVGNPDELLQGHACMGGLTLRGQSLLLAEHLTVAANAPFGLGSERSMISVGGYDAYSNVAHDGGWTGSAWGDGGSFVNQSFAILDHEQVLANERAGLLFANSSGNLGVGTITGNDFGMVLTGASSVNYGDASRSWVDLDGNKTQAIVVTGGNLPVPSAPLDVPSP